MTTWLFISYLTFAPILGHEHDWSNDRASCLAEVRALLPYKYLVQSMCVPVYVNEQWEAD